MQAIRSGLSARSAIRTPPLENNSDRPPSPGGSSITTNRSKKEKFSIFKLKAKRALGVLTRQDSFHSPAGIVGAADSSLPVGDDSTSAALPKLSEVSSTDVAARNQAKEAHVALLDPQSHQTLVGGSSPALTTDHEEATQFSVPQSTTEGEIGAETANPQNQTSSEFKVADIASSSGVDMNASAFDIIPSMQGENEGVQKSMERSERSDESVAVVHPAEDVTPLVQITPASPAVGEAHPKAVLDAAARPSAILQPVPVQLEDHHGDALRRMGHSDHNDADDEGVQSSSLDQSAILSSLDSIAYAGGARRLSLGTTPPTTDILPGRISGCLFIGLLALLIFWGTFFMFLDPTVTGLFAHYRQVNAFGGQNHSKDGHGWYTVFEEASLVAERRANAMLYGSSIVITVCLTALFVLSRLQLIPSSPSLLPQPSNRQRLGKHRQAAVVLGTTTALLTMRSPTDSRSRAAGFLVLLCAGGSLVASGIAVVRLWRLSSSSTDHFGTAGSFFSEFLPALAGGGEAIFVLDPRSAFTLKASLPSPIAPPCTSVPPVPTLSRWIF